MRPRVFPAEDFGYGYGDGNGNGCFNEAAGIPRGRRVGAATTYGIPSLALQ